MLKTLQIYIGVICISAFMVQPCQAQGGDNPNIQPWFDLTVFNEFNKHFEFYGDAGYRRILGVDYPWNRYYIRPAAKYSPWKWLGIRAGVALFYTDNTSIPDVLELRPWQGVSIGWPKFRAIRFSHYFRLEQRIFYRADEWKASPTALRFRYQLSGRYQPQPDKKTKYIYFPAFFELFANRADKGTSTYGLDRNEGRIGVGLGYTFNFRWSGQFNFIFQRSINELGNFKTSDHLLRFSLRYELVPMKDMKRVED